MLRPLGKHVSDLKEPVKQANERIKEDIQLSKGMRAMKRDAAHDADDIDEKTSKDMKKVMQDMFKQFQKANPGGQGGGREGGGGKQKNRRDEEPDGDSKKIKVQTEPFVANPAIAEPNKTTKAKFPDAATSDMRPYRRTVLKGRCVSCKGATQRATPPPTRLEMRCGL